MGFAEDDRNQILAALRSRIQTAGCHLCRTTSWTLADGFVSVGIQDDFSSFRIGGAALPCVALVCNNFGNTCLINVMALGLRHLAEQARTEAHWDLA